MRRQLKLQGQHAGPCAKTDKDETSNSASSSSLRLLTEPSDSEHWEGRAEAENYPWTKAASAAVAQRSGKWESRRSEELRSCSIAKLRAKAREHEAEIHGAVNMSGGDTQSQTQDADAARHDWSLSHFLFVQRSRTQLPLTRSLSLLQLYLCTWCESNTPLFLRFMPINLYNDASVHFISKGTCWNSHPRFVFVSSSFLPPRLEVSDVALQELT